MDIAVIAKDAMMTDFYFQRVYACNKIILYTCITESSMMYFSYTLYVSLDG